MRYITNAEGYLSAVSFGGEIECADGTCTEYTGSVPTGYISLVDWYADEAEKLHRWKVVDGHLTLDGAVPESCVLSNGVYYPRLSAQRKAAIKTLMDAYYNVRETTFCYDWGVIRNGYANNRCWHSEWGKFRMCCATFVELVWMGRAVSDFVGKDGTTYTNKITPAFDWGYYFQYKDRANIGGVVKRSDGAITGYHKYKRPLGTDEYSYSINTVYDADRVGDAAYPNAQSFMGFMMAHDMAKELYRLGCEIPFDELDVGDLLFISDKWDEPVNEHLFIQNTRFRGITHVAMVYKKDGDTLMLIDCTDDAFNTPAGTGLPLLICREDHSSEMSTRARAIYMQSNVVMCARHPAAWGKSNMAGRGQIDYMPLAAPDGLTFGRAIPFGETMSGMVVTEGLWYVDVNTNKLGTALVSGKVTKWFATAFDTKYSNAT